MAVSFFPHYFIMAQFSEKKFLNINTVFDFSTTSFGKVSFCKKNSAQCFPKYTIDLC